MQSFEPVSVSKSTQGKDEIDIFNGYQLNMTQESMSCLFLLHNDSPNDVLYESDTMSFDKFEFSKDSSHEQLENNLLFNQIEFREVCSISDYPSSNWNKQQPRPQEDVEMNLNEKELKQSIEKIVYDALNQSQKNQQETGQLQKNNLEEKDQPLNLISENISTLDGEYQIFKLFQYLDFLFAKLPPESIREFLNSPYCRIYTELFSYLEEKNK